MTTQSFSLTNGNQDAEERTDTNASNLASSDLEIGRDAAAQLVGIVWPNVTIPQGVTIVDAYITFTSTEERSGAMTVSINGHDIDNAAEFSAAAADISSRTLTTAQVNWTPEAWSVGLEYDTPNIATIVHEIVNRPGWVSGNRLAIIIGEHATERRTAVAYNGTPADAPVLTVTYSTTPPDAPSDLTGTAASTSQIDLTWTDNADDETGFELERSPNGTSGWERIATPAANATSYSDTGLERGTTYYYRIRAVGAGNSDYSDVAALSTKAGGLIQHYGEAIRYTKRVSTVVEGEPLNLIVNPTFDDNLNNWVTAGESVTRETDTGRTTPAARVVQTTDGNAAIQSNFFLAKPDHRYYFSLDLKMVDVVHNTAADFYKLRVTLRFYDENQNSIRHYDRVQSWGDREWSWGRVRRDAIAPQGTAYATLTVQLSTTTGEFWVDNVEVYEQAPKGPSITKGVYNPVIIPKPWRMFTSGRKAVMGTLTEGVQGDTAIDAALAAVWPDNDWSDLTDEGYFISIDDSGNVVLGGKAAVGLFYAQRTFESLQDGLGNVYICRILDTPTLARRGLVIGVQNWSIRETIPTEMSKLKYNFTWHQGSFLQNAFGPGGWRDPLTTEQEGTMAAFLAACNANYITPWMALSPRGTDFASATTYSDSDEVTAAANKLIELYDLGYRHLGIVYDDLQNTGQDALNAADQLEYASIAEAHADFTTNVYNAIDTHASESFEFAIIPLWYNGVSGFGTGQKDYIDTMLAGIPSAIRWVVVGPEAGEAALFYSWTGKQATMWDNFWASFYVPISRPAPTYVVPLMRTYGAEPEDEWDGYLLLPPPPTGDALSASKMEWKTGADFAWAPDRYDMDDAEKRAIADYLGAEDVPWIDL